MTDVVGSAAFELRASRDRIAGDMEAARLEIVASAKKTEAELAVLIGGGAEKGNKKAADSFEAPKVAATASATAIKATMAKAGDDIAAGVKAGSDKAKAELDSLAAKTRQIEQIKLPTPTIPTAATHVRNVNPINGAESWTPRDVLRSATPVSTAAEITRPTPNITAPALKDTGVAAKETARNLDAVGKSGEAAAQGLGSVGSASHDTSSVLSKAAFAFTALFAIIGTGIALAIRFGSASLEMADKIADSAERIGIGTEALQEYQYVARKTGQDANAVGGDLENFSNKLAKAQAGLSKSDADAFAALFGKDFDLKQLTDTEKALDLVIDRIGELKSPSDRAAIAEKLGLGSLATAAREGSEEIARLRDEARDLGFVMEEDLIKKGADAADKMDDLTQIIGIQLAGAFIDLSDEVIAFTGHIADALQGLNSFIGKYNEWKARANATYGETVVSDTLQGNSFQALRTAVGSVFSGRTHNAMQTVSQGGDLYSGMPSMASLQSLAAPPRVSRERSELTGRTDLTPVTPRGRADNSAQRAAEQEARRAARVEEEIARARTRVLGIVDEELQTVQQRYDTAKAQVEAERAAEVKQLEGRLARGEVTAAELEQLTLINTQTAALEDRVAADILSRDLADERLAKERALIDLTADMITLQASAARTAAERSRLEAQLLAMAQRRAREDLETQLARTPGLSEQDKTARRNGLADHQMAERRVAGERNLTPMQEWHNQSLRDAEELSEAYQSVAARGLDALNEGIVDAIMNSKNLGEVFSSVAKQILADLLSISVRRSITEPLANALFGGSGAKGGGGGMGSFISSAVSSFFGGFGRKASGGPVSAGQGYIVGEHRPEIFVPSTSGTIIPNVGGGGERPPSIVFAPVINAQGAGPREVDALKGELAKMRREFPGMAVGAVNDAAIRGGIVYGRPA